MNTIRKLALVHALVASFGLVIPAQAAEKIAQNSTAVEVCATASNGSVPKEKLVRALNRMLDMGETPMAATLGKEEKRKRQFDAFWAELSMQSGG